MSETRVALITGAAHGQGRATALALAKEGYHIAALDIAKPLAYPGYKLGTPDDLASLATECGKIGVKCLTFAADVRDDAAVSAAVEETVAGSAVSTCCSTTRASAATAWPTS